MSRLSRMRRVALVTAVACAVLALDRTGTLGPLDEAISDARMELSPREAGGDIALLAIDKHSLDAVGVWPWPRQIHGEIVERLADAGAAATFLDIDFSAASTPEADRAFASSLEKVGGGTVLAAFAQRRSADPRDTTLGLNLPIPELRSHAWIGMVNVMPDGDGLVRRFPFAGQTDDAVIPSMPALLAGRLGDPQGSFGIDFSIDPRSIPVYSIADLLSGAVGRAELEGRTVLVGAHAAELGDNLAVPVRGILPGPILQILAAETLAKDRVLRTAGAPMLLVMLIVLAAGAAVAGARLTSEAVGAAIVVVLVEAAAFVLFDRYAIVLPTASIHVFLGALLVGSAIIELDLRGWLLNVARVEVANSRSILQQVFFDSSDVVLVVREDRRILEWSMLARQMFDPSNLCPSHLGGVLPAEVERMVERAIADLKSGASCRSTWCEIAHPVGTETRVLEVSVTPSKLTGFRRRPGSLYIASVTMRDVTSRREHEKRLDQLARFDQLTGAMRRSEFVHQLDAARSGGEGVAIFAVNLHRFKTVNGTYGRAVGDAVLQKVVRRLDGLDPRFSASARLEGDTFALFAPLPLEAEAPAGISRQLIEAVAEPLGDDASNARLGARVGFALIEASDPVPSAEAVARAELALDEARRVPGSAVRTFDAASGARQARARHIESELWKALDRDELYLAYQPQVRLSDLRTIGAEALIRWEHPDLGFVSPLDIIGISEANGFIDELGRWVLERACREAADWPDGMSVAVNVSPAQFIRTDLLDLSRRALAAARLPASRLTLEITESLFLGDEHIEILHDLRMLGIGLALDDFGTGFASLGYLVRFPLDKIKVDRMFVQRIVDDRGSQAILRSVSGLARDLGATLLCEGIEDEGQAAFLAGLGCQEAQGYLYGKPQRLEEFVARYCGRSDAA